MFPYYALDRPVEGTDPRDRQRILTHPYRYAWDHQGARMRLTVPQGFIHNGASVPGIVRSIIPPEPLDKAAIGHDWIHHWCGALPVGSLEVLTADGWTDALEHPDGRLRWTRKLGDRWMMRMSREDPWGPKRWRRRMAYRALRAFGWTAWDCSDKEG